MKKLKALSNGELWNVYTDALETDNARLIDAIEDEIIRRIREVARHREKKQCTNASKP